MKTIILLLGLQCAIAIATPLPQVHPEKPLVLRSFQSTTAPAPEKNRKSPIDLKKRLGLEEAISIALANNPELGALKWDSTAAGARLDATKGKRLPDLQITGNYTYYMDDQRLIPKRGLTDVGVFSQNIATTDLVVTLPIYTGGTLVNEMKAAELLHLAALHRLARSRNELIFNVTSTFCRILSQEHVIDSIEFSMSSLKQHLATVNALIAAKKAAKVDRLRTEVRLADISQNLVQAKNILSVQYRILGSLMGLEDLLAKLKLEGDLAALTAEPVPDLATAMATALQNRQDLRATENQMNALAHSLKAARGERRPSVSLKGSYGERWALNPANVNDDASGSVAFAGLSVRLPLFKGGQLKARTNERKAQYEAAKERYRLLHLQVRLSVETALLNTVSAGERIRTTEKAVSQAKESLRIEKLKYESSKGTMVDVLDAQAALLTAQTSYYQALADFHTSMAQLKLSMGEKR